MFEQDTNTNSTESVQQEQVSFRDADESQKLEMIRQMRMAEDQQPPQEESDVIDEPEVEEPEEPDSVKAPTQPEIDIDDFENIDPNKLPPELKAVYKNMEKLMQRKSQELSQKIKALEEVSTKQQPQQTTNDFAKQYEQIHQQASAMAMQQLGINDPEEFWPDAKLGNPAHAAAYQYFVGQVSNENYQKQLLQQQVQYVRQTMESDPTIIEKFDEAMYGLLATGKEGRDKFARVFEARSRFFNGNPTAQDLQVLDAHYAYANQPKQAQKEPAKPVIVPDKPKVAPNKVEKSGVEQKQQAPTVDMRKYKHSSEDDKFAAIRAARKAGLI